MVRFDRPVLLTTVEIVLLLPTGSNCEEAWITAVTLVPEAERLRFLVALRPGIMSPTAASLLGSPRMQWSNVSPRAAAHCRSLMVPLTATLSSSPVIKSEIEP